MWCRLTSRISEGNVDVLLRRANAIVSSANDQETLRWCKDFFAEKTSERENLDLLKRFHQEIWSEISDAIAFDVPVVDHAILLIKGAGAAGMSMHQDRAYWIGRESVPSTFSVWIALSDMSEENGGLVLSCENQVDVSRMSSFNTGSIIEHQEDVERVAGGGFPITIRDQIAVRMADSMKFVSLSRGEAIAFDSFEPHMSGPNTTPSPRLAMKIAYAEGRNKARYLARTDALDGWRNVGDQAAGGT